MALNGVVARLVTARGFGFVARDRDPGEPGEPEYFFHARVVEGARFRELREGQRVTFEALPAQLGHGPRASRVVFEGR
jgi:cold shock CspA family protein